MSSPLEKCRECVLPSRARGRSSPAPSDEDALTPARCAGGRGAGNRSSAIMSRVDGRSLFLVVRRAALSHVSVSWCGGVAEYSLSRGTRGRDVARVVSRSFKRNFDAVSESLPESPAALPGLGTPQRCFSEQELAERQQARPLEKYSRLGVP